MTYPLDGNAIAGDLFAAYGREMTSVGGRCRNCGTACAVADSPGRSKRSDRSGRSASKPGSVSPA